MIATTERATELTVTSSNAAATERLNLISAQLNQHFASDSASAIDNSSKLSLTKLASLLSQHCHLASITTLLSSLIQSPELLAKIAARSYWHGNGFLKVVLLDQGYKLRLHIWFAGTSCEENIHSHRWGFASHVLTGALSSEIWADAANDDLAVSDYASNVVPATSQALKLQTKEYVYTAKHQSGHTSMLPHKQYIGKAYLQKLLNVTQTAGASYLMTPDQLHRINHPGQELVATIICTAPTQILTNRLFPTIDDPNLQPANLSADELKHALTRYINHSPLAA
ncbi:hypothetical protein FHS24_000610 [Psychrobacter luti]|uniref:Cysteine dioxygenase n=1 Tax=Psychrobacter luti TaxID=198481 RepID=A0A839TAE8_9GAMM|nr:hypothetical protein [Psychrobacter luti]MBB3106119.1 hypothetical protein [Psychrobacter luti]